MTLPMAAFFPLAAAGRLQGAGSLDTVTQGLRPQPPGRVRGEWPNQISSDVQPSRSYWGDKRESLNPKYAQPKNPFELIYSLN